MYINNILFIFISTMTVFQYILPNKAKCNEENHDYTNNYFLFLSQFPSVDFNLKPRNTFQFS